ncbi:hypothetical protein M5689_004580 [Euphorbia peplus]|nr:hypothetical protein M5689_004580 [Euphorbia peplus]
MWAMMSFPTPKPTTPPISGNPPPPSRHRKQQQPIKKNQENQNNKGAVSNKLSGLDVLWAMQKAADKKNMRTVRNRKREKSESELESESESGVKEEYGGDYSNVRPLLIKEEWAAQLDELDKCLQELCDTK